MACEGRTVAVLIKLDEDLRWITPQHYSVPDRGRASLCSGTRIVFLSTLLAFVTRCRNCADVRRIESEILDAVRRIFAHALSNASTSARDLSHPGQVILVHRCDHLLGAHLVETSHRHPLHD